MSYVLKKLSTEGHGLLDKVFLIFRNILVKVFYELKQLIIVSLNEYCWFHSLNNGLLLAIKHVGLKFKLDGGQALEVG